MREIDKSDSEGKEKSEFVNNRVDVKNEANRQSKCVKGDQYKVLIVNNEMSNLHILANLLEQEDCIIEYEISGLKALRRLENGEVFDLILLDADLSSVSGYEVCREIRETYSMLELPILITTEIKSSDFIETCFEAGANDFITKPYKPAEIKTRVRTMFTQRKLMKESLENEAAYLQSQIKPHFLHNAISNIIAICNEDGDRAVLMLSSLSIYLRNIFQNSQSTKNITIDQELEIINSYVDIEKLRLGSHLKYKVFIDKGILETGALIPAFIIQPLIENAIRHGVFFKKGAGTVILTILNEETEIKIIVKDNGIGMSHDQIYLAAQGMGKGVGLKNVKRRVEFLPNSSFHIESQIEKGTICRIILKKESLEYKES